VIEGAGLEPYTHDATFMDAALPCAVFPGTTEEVAAVVRTCSELEIPVLARGGGSSLVGGSVPLGRLALPNDVAQAALYLASGLRHLPSIDLTSLAGKLVTDTPASAVVLGDEQFAQALAHRASPPGFVDTSNTRLFAEGGAVQRLEATANGQPPVCAVLFSSGRLAHLPGFDAWVARH